MQAVDTFATRTRTEYVVSLYNINWNTGPSESGCLRHGVGSVWEYHTFAGTPCLRLHLCSTNSRLQLEVRASGGSLSSEFKLKLKLKAD